MTKKPTLTTVASGYQSTTMLNANLNAINNALDNTLSLDGSTPNNMTADIDLNSNDLLNVSTTHTTNLYLDGSRVVPEGTLNTVSNMNVDEFTGDGSTVAYVLSSNPLTLDVVIVNVDGVAQLTTSYTLSVATITFSTAPPLNSAIQIRYFTGIQLGSTTSSDLVSYNQGSTGHVGRTVESRLRDHVSVLDFGAVGDGVTNDTAAVTLAMNAATGGVLDGGGLTYKCNSVIVCTSENIVVQNMTLDFSGVPDQTGSPDFILSFAGTQGTATNLTANATPGHSGNQDQVPLQDDAYVLTVGSTSGFAADEYAWLASSTVFESSTSTTLGQIVQIKSVDTTTQLTLYNDVLYDFTTTATASIAPLALKRNIRFRDVNFIGANTFTQSVLNFDKCSYVDLTGCTFDLCDYAACRLSRTVNFKASNCTVRRGRGISAGYGFAVMNGCYSVKIINNYGEDLGSFVYVGDNDGVNLFVEVSNNHTRAATLLYAHPACDFLIVNGNNIEDASRYSLDGVWFQGLNCVITNNNVVGVRRYSIRHQCLPDIGVGSCVISGNQLLNSGGSYGADSAIYVTSEPGAGGSHLDGVVISGNIFLKRVDRGIKVEAKSGNIKNVAVTGNVANDTNIYGACLLYAASGYTLDNVTVTGNVFETTGTGPCLNITGTGTQNVSNVIISGNSLKGNAAAGFPFSEGIHLRGIQNVIETGNYITGTPKIENHSATNVYLDSRQSVPVTVTNSTYVILPQDEDIIANRAGTITLTIPPAATYPGRTLNIKTIQAQTVVSGASDVYPINTDVLGTAILAAVDGAWVQLRSNGTGWITMQKG